MEDQICMALGIRAARELLPVLKEKSDIEAKVESPSWGSGVGPWTKLYEGTVTALAENEVSSLIEDRRRQTESMVIKKTLEISKRIFAEGI